jgi:AcrR family transcriptional regulator
VDEEGEERGSSARILAAATELLVEEGYGALSMRRVAARVGLSQAAIYRHYRDKAALVGKIVAEGYSGLVELVEALDDRSRPPDLLLATGIRAYVDFATRSSSIFKAVLLQDIGPSGAAVDALSPAVAGRRRTFALLTELVRRGMDEGLFAPSDPELTAQAVWAAMFGLASRAAIEGGSGHATLVVDRQIEILLRGLGACGPKELS